MFSLVQHFSHLVLYFSAQNVAFYYQLYLLVWNRCLGRSKSLFYFVPLDLEAKLARLAVDFLSTIQLLPIGAQSLLAQLILL